MTNPDISVIIATFNSERTLELTLNSINKQIFPKDKVEILIVDGGSTDSTIVLAKKNNARIITNPQTEPVYAKYLGILNSKGKYAIFIDHDECIESKTCFQDRMQIFNDNKSIKAIVSTGYNDPPNSSIINSYINEFGDPFSYFIYKLSKKSEYFIATLRERIEVLYEDDKYILFDFYKSNKPIIMELCAAAGMIDLEWIKFEYKSNLKPKMIPHLFYDLINDQFQVAITKCDSITHNSTERISKYLNKLKWRIKNNIFHITTLGMSGYSGREKYMSRYNAIKKFLFLPYALLILPSLLDSIQLSASRKRIGYVIHTFLCFYTAIMIVYYYLLKLFGVHLTLRSYDEKIKIHQQSKDNI
jgi:glycosyltransferase involved in cell wall biosynthesis